MSQYGVLPSRMTLQTYKIRAVGAKKGYELLKKKSDALKKAFRAILAKIVESKVRMAIDYREARMGMAEANFAAGDFSRAVIDNVATVSPVRMTMQQDNIAGVKLPIFKLKDIDEFGDSALLGLSMGGQSIQTARDRYTKYLKILITIATLQTQFITLDEALKMTNRRVNALEFVLIPRIAEIIDYIKQELDEIDREDFVRLKKTQDNKKKKKRIQAAEEAKRKGKGGAEGEEGTAEGPEVEEEDVIPANPHGQFEEDSEEDEDIFV